MIRLITSNTRVCTSYLSVVVNTRSFLVRLLFFVLWLFIGRSIAFERDESADAADSITETPRNDPILGVFVEAVAVVVAVVVVAVVVVVVVAPFWQSATRRCVGRTISDHLVFGLEISLSLSHSLSLSLLFPSFASSLFRRVLSSLSAF